MEITDPSLEGTTADEVVTSKMKDYAIHTHLSKLPHIVDGLKPIHRRILWTVKDGDKAHKVSTWTGNIMAKYHPTGNTSIEDAIARLAQPFNNIVPLVHSGSNVGAYGGGDAAQARYLPIRSSPFAVDMFFGTSDHTLNYVATETGEGVEPEYLIPKLPTALITGSFGIAIGHKSQLQSINLGSLCQLVIDYVALKQKYKTVPRSIMIEELSHHLLPDFPVASYLRNEKALLTDYKTANFDSTILTDGIIQVTPTAIIIKTLPFGENINSMYQNLLNHLRGKEYSRGGRVIIEKENFISKNCQKIDDLSKGHMEARIELTMKRGVSPFKILDQLKKTIGFTKQWKPITLLVNKQNKSQYMTPLDILEAWYTERARSIMAELKHTQNRYIKRLRELSALIIINDDLDFVLNLFKSSSEVGDTIDPLCKRFKLTQAQAKFLSDLKMGQITRIGIQKLLDDKKDTEQKLADLKSKFIDIPKQIAGDAQKIMDRYASKYPRKCVTSSFIGFVKVEEDGIIQYSSISELELIMSRFSNSNLEINLFPAGQKNKLIIDNDTVFTEEDECHPKQFTQCNFHVSRLKPKYSIGLRKDTIYRVQGLVYKEDKDLSFIYVGDSFTTVSRYGVVENVQTTSITSRKAVVATGVLTDYAHVSPVVSDEVYVIYINSKQRNIVSIDRVSMGSKIRKLPMGKTTIINVVKVGEPLMFTVPSIGLKRCNINQFYIQNKNFLEPNSHVKLELTRKSCSDGRKIRKRDKRSQLYTVK